MIKELKMYAITSCHPLRLNEDLIYFLVIIDNNKKQLWIRISKQAANRKENNCCHLNSLTKI